MAKFEGTSFKRSSTSHLKNELHNGRSFLLLGPRQTGKTTLLEEIFSGFPPQHILKYYLQLPSTRQLLEEDPEVLLREVEALGSKSPVWVLIDEIQKLPQLFDVLQFLIDQKKIILAATGSSARKMRVMGANWLPGRIRLHHLFPLTWEESGLRKNPKNMQTYLLYGALPAILREKDLTQREAELKAYSHLYLEEEIRLEAAVRNIPRFHQLLRLAALESGTAPNFSKLGTQVGLSHTSIREHYDLLEDTLMVHRLPAYGSKRDAVLRASRYYFFDLGVRNAAAGLGHSPGILPLQRGLLFEHFIILEIFAYFKDRASLYFYRSKQGEEVDLVMEYNNQLIAIEIKATTHPTPKNFLGLKVFKKKYDCHKAFVVCQVARGQRFGDFEAIPWKKLVEKVEAADL